MSVVARVWRPRAPPFLDPPGYLRHRPEATLLYRLVKQHCPAFRELRAEAGRALPGYVAEEFGACLKCGRLEEGFLRLRCEQCHAEKLVAFSCKNRGFCPSCGARRMAEPAALLADAVLPEQPLRHRDDTTHIVLKPLHLIARLAALLPPPRMHWTRYHGVFAPHSRFRAAVTPAHRGAGSPKQSVPSGEQDRPAATRHLAMNWARRLKRVFGTEIDTCTRCGGKLGILSQYRRTRRHCAHPRMAVVRRLFIVQGRAGLRCFFMPTKYCQWT